MRQGLFLATQTQRAEEDKTLPKHQPPPTLRFPSTPWLGPWALLYDASVAQVFPLDPVESRSHSPTSKALTERSQVKLELSPGIALNFGTSIFFLSKKKIPLLSLSHGTNKIK
jgi:hypothetical protein